MLIFENFSASKKPQNSWSGDNEHPEIEICSKWKNHHILKGSCQCCWDNLHKWLWVRLEMKDYFLLLEFEWWNEMKIKNPIKKISPSWSRQHWKIIFQMEKIYFDTLLNTSKMTLLNETMADTESRTWPGLREQRVWTAWPYRIHFNINFSSVGWVRPNVNVWMQQALRNRKLTHQAQEGINYLSPLQCCRFGEQEEHC